jgi:hypothetical protein
VCCFLILKDYWLMSQYPGFVPNDGDVVHEGRSIMSKDEWDDIRDDWALYTLFILNI